MPYFADRVKESLTGSAPGTGNVTVNGTGATGGYQSLNSAHGVGAYFKYVIEDAANSLWETGRGYLSSSTTLVRDVVESGSSGPGTLVNFTSGTLTVYTGFTAESAEQTGHGHMLAAFNGWNMS